MSYHVEENVWEYHETIRPENIRLHPYSDEHEPNYKIEEWKRQYFISSEPVKIFGVNGWYVDLEFGRFRHPDLSVFQKQEYAAILLLIDLLNFCDEDAMEYKSFLNQIKNCVLE